MKHPEWPSITYDIIKIDFEFSNPSSYGHKNIHMFFTRNTYRCYGMKSFMISRSFMIEEME